MYITYILHMYFLLTMSTISISIILKPVNFINIRKQDIDSKAE